MKDTSAENMPDLLRGNTDGLLLSLIDSLNGAYGYKLIREVENRSRGLFQFKEGTVYPTLRKLENEGLIEGEWQALPSGHNRRFYRITRKGKEALETKRAIWQGFTSAMDLILNPART
jgi:DNA-binding PadR family transcriptional regulator